MLWGNNPDEAKANYNDFKTKVDNKAAEVKTRLDAIAAEEANAAAQAQSSAQNSSGNGSSGSYSGGGSGSYTPGGGGQSGPTLEQAEAAWQAYVQNCHAHGMEPILSHDEFIRKYMYGG